MPYKPFEAATDESPSLLKRITTPIVDQLPSGVKQALENFATPGLHSSEGIKDPFTGNPLGAELKGFVTGATEAVTPSHIAQAATLSPELMGASALTRGLSLGGNVVGAAQGASDVMDPNKTTLEKVIGAGNAALSGVGVGRQTMAGLRGMQSAGKAVKAAEAVAPEVSEVSTVQGLHQRLRNIREATLRNDKMFPGGHELTPPEQMHVQDQILKERQFGGGGKNSGPYEQAMKNHTDLLGMAHKTSESQFKPIESAQKRAAGEVDNLLKNQEQQQAADELARRKAELELKNQSFTETTTAGEGGKKTVGRESYGPPKPEPKEPPVTKASGEPVPPRGPSSYTRPVPPPPAGPEVVPSAPPVQGVDPSKVRAAAESIPYTEPIQTAEPLQLGPSSLEAPPVAEAPVAPPEAPLPSPEGVQAEAQASLGVKPKGKGRMPKLSTPKGFQQAAEGIANQAAPTVVPPVPEASPTPSVEQPVPQATAPEPQTPPVEPQAAAPIAPIRTSGGTLRGNVTGLDKPAGGRMGPGGIYASEGGIAQRNYRQALEAVKRGEPVPPEVLDNLRVQNEQAAIANKTTQQAAQTAKDVAPAQAELDAISKMAPEERAAFIQRMKSEGGAVDPMIALRLGLGTAGALTGGAVDPVGSATGEHTMGTRAASALGGGALGAMAPSAFNTVVNAPYTTMAANEAANQSFMQKLNHIHNIGLLSPLSVAKKALGDVGGLASAGTENALSNLILRATGNEPVERGSIIKTLLTKAPEIYQTGKEALTNPPGLDQSGVENLVSKMTAGKANPLSWAGRAMSGLTAATKKALGEAGYTGDEQKLYTMTSRPQTDMGAGAYDLWRRSKAAQFLQPLARMGINRLERGFERSPLQAVRGFSNAGSPQERAKMLARIGIGSGLMGAAYEATPEDFATKHPIEAGLIGAVTGPYGVPVLAGMAASTFGKSPTAQVAKTISKDIPGMQSMEYLSRSPEEWGRTALSGFTNITAPIAQLTNPGKPVTQGPSLNLPQRLTYRALSNIPGVRGMLPQQGEASGIEGLTNDELMELLK